MRPALARSLAALPLAAALAAALAACADDPTYLPGPTVIEVVPEDGEGGGTATASVTLPIRLERAEEAEARAELAAELGVVVPYVTVEDLDVEIEWRLRNLSEEIATATILVNGGNEAFRYDPLAFTADPEEEEPPPPLLGGVPYRLDPLADRDGVFREDQLDEGALDLELITRGAVNAYTALLGVDEDRVDFADGGAGAVVPREAWASLVVFDITVVADQHVALEYAIRVRDHRDPELVHPDGFAAPAGELTAFAPADFEPPPPEEEP